MSTSSCPIAVRMFFLSLLLILGCSDESDPLKPDDRTVSNSGRWSFSWENDSTTVLAYEIAFASLNADGSLTMMFMEDELSSTQLGSAIVGDIHSLSANEYYGCSLLYVFGQDPMDIAITMDPLVTEVLFTKLEPYVGGHLTGSFRGELSTSDFPELERVAILDATFADVCVMSEDQ